MFCPQCHAEFREGFLECSDCHVPLLGCLIEPPTPVDSSIDSNEEAGRLDLDVLIRTGLGARNWPGEGSIAGAGIRFFTMDQNAAARQESGSFLGWWDAAAVRFCRAW